MAAHAPKAGSDGIVFNPEKAFPCLLQPLIDNGPVKDTGIFLLHMLCISAVTMLIHSMVPVMVQD